MASISNSSLSPKNSSVSSTTTVNKIPETTQKTVEAVLGVFSNAPPILTQSHLRYGALQKCFQIHKIQFDLTEQQIQTLFEIFQAVDSPVPHTLSDFFNHAIDKEYKWVINSLDKDKESGLIAKYEKQQKYFHETCVALSVGCQFKHFFCQALPDLKVSAIEGFYRKVGLINEVFKEALPERLGEGSSMDKKVVLWQELIKKKWYVEIFSQDFVSQAVETFLQTESKERELIQNGLASTLISSQIQPSVYSIKSRIENAYPRIEEVISLLIVQLKMHLAFYSKNPLREIDDPCVFLQSLIDSLSLLEKEQENKGKELKARQIMKKIIEKAHDVDAVGALYKKAVDMRFGNLSKNVYKRPNTLKPDTKDNPNENFRNYAPVEEVGAVYRGLGYYVGLLHKSAMTIHNTVDRDLRCLVNRLYENLRNYAFLDVSMKKQEEAFPEMVKKFRGLVPSLLKDKKLFDEATDHILAKPDEAQGIDRCYQLQLYAQNFLKKVDRKEGLAQFQALQSEFSKQASELYKAGKEEDAQKMEAIYSELCMNLLPIFLCLHDFNNLREDTIGDQNYIHEDFLDCFFLQIETSQAEVEFELDSEEEFPVQLSDFKEQIQITEDRTKSSGQSVTTTTNTTSSSSKSSVKPKDKAPLRIHPGTKTRKLIATLCQGYGLIVHEGGRHTLLKTSSGELVGVVPRGSRDLASGTFDNIVKRAQDLLRS